jgi:hypothetical protein
MATKLARHRAVNIVSLISRRRTLGIFKPGFRHAHRQIGRAAGDISALTTMALQFHHRIALGLVFYFAAIAASGK